MNVNSINLFAILYNPNIITDHTHSGISTVHGLIVGLLHSLGVAVGLLAKARLKMIGTPFGLLCAVVGVSLLVGA